MYGAIVDGNDHLLRFFPLRTRRLHLKARNLQYFWQQRRWLRRLGISSLLSMLMLATWIVPAYAGTITTSAQVTVNPSKVLSTLSPLSLGVNDAVWDGNLLDSQVPGLLRDAGVKVMRYP